ncbi:MAG: FtsW/RodA/SpoVE family cell cycle protein [Clostridia bacterium]|nr:FtsW/RodA/SpoVE family cell cycle protein [Clostridia bacterium]
MRRLKLGSAAKGGRCDRLFLILTLLLVAYGTVMVFTSGSAYALFRYGDAFYFVKRQTIWLVLGLAAMLLASQIKMDFFKKATLPAYFFTILLLVLVLVIGLVGNGAKRWISVGPITIQPSEIAKLTMVMMLALYFSSFESAATEQKSGRRSLVYGTLIPFSIMLLPILLVMLQKHLSCIIILGTIGLILIVLAGVNLKYISVLTALGATGVAYIALFTDYTKERITVWQNPEAYKLTGGWQTLQGLMAIGSGGIFGKGLGGGELKHCYVSEPANDMIFAILCEELGLIGGAAAIALFAALVLRGYTIALRAPDTYSRLIVLGITTKVAVQTLLNIAVVTNTIPNTGISLPFFSYGGSSLVMLLFEMGIILSVSRRSKIQK